MNVSGMYRLPGDVQLAVFLQAKRGLTGQRTNIFRVGGSRRRHAAPSAQHGDAAGSSPTAHSKAT